MGRPTLTMKDCEGNPKKLRTMQRRTREMNQIAGIGMHPVHPVAKHMLVNIRVQEIQH